MSDFVIYGRDNCIWCDRAVELAQDLDLNFSFKNIETNLHDRQEFREKLPTARTVPQVFYKDRHVGSYEQFVKWLGDNEWLRRSIKD